MKFDTYSLQRASQTNRSSQREGYLTEQRKMLGGTVKSLVFRLEVKNLIKRVHRDPQRVYRVH